MDGWEDRCFLATTCYFRSLSTISLYSVVKFNDITYEISKRNPNESLSRIHNFPTGVYAHTSIRSRTRNYITILSHVGIALIYTITYITYVLLL